jgi:GH15 family glucan-1,4-alpha-glucosidase
LTSSLPLTYFINVMNKAPEEAKPASNRARPQVERSVARILHYQDETGAFVASPDFAQYQYCWLRDGSFIAHALDRVGALEAAGRFHEWCAGAIERVEPLIVAALGRLSAGLRVEPQAMPPARFSLGGHAVEDDWPNFQVDGYGTWLWSLQQHLQADGGRVLPSGLAPAVEITVSYLAAFGTSCCFDMWEEDGSSVHTATIGSVYAGLRSAAAMLGVEALEGQAEAVRASVLDQAREDGYFRKSDHSPDVDGALLWLGEPFKLVGLREPAFVETVERISAQLDLDGGVRRNPTDTYYGGGAWPVLTASLGWYYASVGDLAEAEGYLSWIEARIDSDGRLGEQFGGEHRDPAGYEEWARRWGPPAADLLWSHAMYIILAAELDARRSPPVVVTGSRLGGTPPAKVLTP